MCNAHLYTHACIYKPFFLIKFMILKDVLPEKVFISECVCVVGVHACVRACTCTTAVRMSDYNSRHCLPLSNTRSRD